jgi:chaperonin GroEL (HSP60 family)
MPKLTDLHVHNKKIRKIKVSSIHFVNSRKNVERIVVKAMFQFRLGTPPEL